MELQEMIKRKGTLAWYPLNGKIYALTIPKDIARVNTGIGHGMSFLKENGTSLFIYNSEFWDLRRTPQEAAALASDQLDIKIQDSKERTARLIQLKKELTREVDPWEGETPLWLRESVGRVLAKVKYVPRLDHYTWAAGKVKGVSPTRLAAQGAADTALEKAFWNLTY